MRSFLLSVLIFLTIGNPLFAASVVQNEQAKAELHVDAAELKAGEPFWAAVELTMPEHWHVYWQNPGDSGMESRLEWTLPQGMTAGPIHWQPPTRIEYSGLFNYGYEGKTAMLVPVTLLENWDGKTFTLAVKADWLICKDICIPESATLDMQVMPGEVSPVIAEYAKTLPGIWPEDAKYLIEGEKVKITVPLEKSGVRDLDQVWWFPIEDGIITNNSEQLWRVDGYNLTITADRGSLAAKPLFPGLLKITSADGVAKHWHVKAHGDESVAALPAPASAKPVAADTPSLSEPITSVTLLSALLSAFLGGLILNIMPCVLPILSLKALSLAKKADKDPAAVRVMGLAYTGGVLACFAAVAGVLIALQQGGAAIGWGFQLQSPIFVTSLIYVLFLVGLNLSGVFELPVLFGSAGGSVTSRDDTRGAFFTGVLATVVATPCTAPFMATALGFALGQPPFISLLIFLSLGLGLASPFLLISFVPALHKALPKPGSWMLRFKQFLAFPIYATAAWLLWVLVQQSGPMGLALALAGLCLIAFGAWLLPLLSRGALLVGAMALVLLIGITIREQSFDARVISNELSKGQELFSMQRLNALRAQGTPIFVDATAAWCITCKVNERVALQSETVKAAFAERGIVMLVADWTNRDAEITEYLKSFGRSGVPIYVYYPPRGEPKLLPQILTPEIVVEALGS
jgi:thiol:disulfide interchange protein/DsbC/DsbD-like thiol-disulfide interchange protein